MIVVVWIVSIEDSFATTSTILILYLFHLPLHYKGGRFFTELVLKPSFQQRGGYKIASINSFVLLSMLSTSFVAHYNAPAFYNELKDASMERFNTVIKGE